MQPPKKTKPFARRKRGKRIDEKPIPKRAPKVETCGDYGGVTDDGKPCLYVAGWGTGLVGGRCSNHTEEALAEIEKLKATFLAEFSKGTIAVANICEKIIKRDVVTVWRWRQRDRVFDEAYQKAQAHVDEIRLALVEDSQFARIVRGDHHASEAIFFLKNRGPRRWRDRTEVTGAEGTALIPLDTIRAILDADDERQRATAK